MIIIKIDERESIDKALKRYKRKFDKTKVVKQLRARKEFTKKSIKRREEIKKAIYVQQKFGNEEND